MSEPAAASQAARPSVFLSYASEDRPAARLLRDALPGYGLEVWYDESDLGGGDAWDRKIRRQIRDCDYFMPLVSAQTERRHEGYFRREWRLAVERTLDMADDHPYLLPIVIDDTEQSGARVPEKFLSVQWLKVPGGRPTQALESMCLRLASGTAGPERTAKSPAGARAATHPHGVQAAQGAHTGQAAQSPVFPVQEPGQTLRFWVEVAGWFCRSAWQQFNRLPKWVRAVAYTWLCIALLSRCNSSSHRHADEVAPAKVTSGGVEHLSPPPTIPVTPEDSPSGDVAPGSVTPANVAKLKAIAQQYQDARNSRDLAKLTTAIAKEFSSDDDETAATSTAASPLLAIAFTAPAGDASAAKLADSTFAMTYGMIEISHHGQVGLTKEPLAAEDLSAAVARGKAAHATYVLYGAVDKAGDTRSDKARALTVKIATVADGTVAWSKTYSAAGADPTKIAADINAHLPPLKEEGG